jgi:hypothetical protein
MPDIPTRLRKQFAIYRSKGFDVERIEQGGRHYKVWFRQFPEMQIVTANEEDWRGIKNSLARFKRLAQAHKERMANESSDMES